MKLKFTVALLAIGLSYSVLLAESAKVSVNGMVCAFCAQGIEKKFKDEKAVNSIDVKLEDKLVTVNFKDGENLSDEKITKLITDAGYSVEGIKRVK